LLLYAFLLKEELAGSELIAFRLMPAAGGFSVGNVTGTSRRAGMVSSGTGCGGDAGRRGGVRVLSKKQMLRTCLTMHGLLLLVGCTSSNIAARRQALAADYAALTAKEKALVDRGELRQGMSTNAVLIAWGQPSIISTMLTPNGPFITWEYYRKRTVTDPSVQREIMVPWSSTPVPISQVFPEAARYYSSSVVESQDRTAVFHKERLVGWSRK
jgi:hypothetical protein